jgi:hypothetical protein
MLQPRSSGLSVANRGIPGKRAVHAGHRTAAGASRLRWRVGCDDDWIPMQKAKTLCPEGHRFTEEAELSEDSLMSWAKVKEFTEGPEPCHRYATYQSSTAFSPFAEKLPEVLPRADSGRTAGLHDIRPAAPVVTHVAMQHTEVPLRFSTSQRHSRSAEVGLPDSEWGCCLHDIRSAKPTVLHQDLYKRTVS